MVTLKPFPPRKEFRTIYGKFIFSVQLSVRLVGGSSSNEGRVEVFYNGVWGTVCDDLWDDVDAGVVCQILGLGDSGTAFSNAAFGQGTGDIILDNVACNGDETDLFDCANNGPNIHNCGHSEDAGVECTSTTSSKSHGILLFKIDIDLMKNENISKSECDILDTRSEYD